MRRHDSCLSSGGGGPPTGRLSSAANGDPPATVPTIRQRLWFPAAGVFILCRDGDWGWGGWGFTEEKRHETHFLLCEFFWGGGSAGRLYRPTHVTSCFQTDVLFCFGTVTNCWGKHASEQIRLLLLLLLLFLLLLLCPLALLASLSV